MALFLYFLCLVINFFYYLNRRKSNVIQILTFCFICALFVGSRNTGDLDNYVQMYQNDLLGLRGIQFLFWWVMDLSHYLNLNFYQFRFIISAISLSLLYVFIKKTSYNPHIVIFIYLLYPVFMDDIQIRNFVAMTFLYMGIFYIIEGKKNWKFHFSVFLILAILNHVLFLIYSIFYLSFNNKKLLIWYSLFFYMLTIILVWNKDKLGLLFNIMMFVDSDKAEIYAEATTRYGALLFVLYQIITISIFYWLIRVVSHRYFPEHVTKYINVLFRLNILISICLPLIVIDFNFYRLMRCLFLINIVCFTNFIMASKLKTMPLILTIIYVYLWANVDLLSANNFTERVEPIFKYNVLSWV